jgi:hypothetical protein
MPFRTPVFKTGAIAILPTLHIANQRSAKSAAMLARPCGDFKRQRRGGLTNLQMSLKRAIVRAKFSNHHQKREKIIYVT